MKSTLPVFFCLVFFPAISVAEISLYVACEGSPNQNAFTVVQYHRLALTKGLPSGQCVESGSRLTISQLESIDAYQQEPQESDIEAYELMRETFSSEFYFEPPRATANVLLILGKHDASSLKTWTKEHMGKYIVVTLDGKVIYLARLMSELSSGRLLMQTEENRGTSKQLADEIRNSYVRSPNTLLQATQKPRA
jgi:hypothetical protein